MRVSSHQIYNILNIYSKWLSKNGAPSIEKFNGTSSGHDRPDISTEKLRKSIMQKVTGTILTKITSLESNGKRSRMIAEKLKHYEPKKGRTDGNKNNGDTFVFNSIDQNNKKNVNTLHIDKSSLLAE